jgi:DNA-directed RNA polymerase subunit RPC12/RpoP
VYYHHRKSVISRSGGDIVESKCPGQDIRNLRAALYKCPNCGAEVEMFSDELRIKCKKCGEYVYKEKTPSCIEWCPSARQCLGEERWKALKGAGL